MSLVSDVENVFEGLWEKILPHVKPIAEQDARTVLDDFKGQASHLLQEVGSDATQDAGEVAKDAGQVSTAVADSVPEPAASSEPAPEQPAS